MPEKSLNIGINGFGRIGRTLFRLLGDHPNINVVAINDLADTRTLAHLVKYDSIHGIFNNDVTYEDDYLLFKDRKIQVFHENHPSKVDWFFSGAEIIIESTGKFKTVDTLQHHLNNGAKKVILSAPPSDDAIKMVVLGVNEAILSQEDDIISNASCTTNNAAPMLKTMIDLCGVEQAYITTVHSYTSDQNLHDAPHTDLRRARAASQSIIPTTTGAAKALTKIFPELSDVIGGCGIRVPVPNGSLTDITLNVSRPTSIEEVNAKFEELSNNQLKNILLYTNEPIVSIDLNNSTHSCTFDSQMTSVIGKMVKIIGWYDNETGYCSRLVDLLELLVRKKFI